MPPTFAAGSPTRRRRWVAPRTRLPLGAVPPSRMRARASRRPRRATLRRSAMPMPTPSGRSSSRRRRSADRRRPDGPVPAPAVIAAVAAPEPAPAGPAAAGADAATIGQLLARPAADAEEISGRGSRLRPPNHRVAGSALEPTARAIRRDGARSGRRGPDVRPGHRHLERRLLTRRVARGSRRRTSFCLRRWVLDRGTGTGAHRHVDGRAARRPHRLARPDTPGGRNRRRPRTTTAAIAGSRAVAEGPLSRQDAEDTSAFASATGGDGSTDRSATGSAESTASTGSASARGGLPTPASDVTAGGTAALPPALFSQQVASAAEGADRLVGDGRGAGYDGSGGAGRRCRCVRRRRRGTRWPGRRRGSAAACGAGRHHRPPATAARGA